MHSVEIAKPYHGAAYQIIYERTCPDFCTTPERLAEIKTEIAGILIWAEAQGADVIDAYQWAAGEILKKLDMQAAHRDLASRVAVAYQTMPKPPAKSVAE